MTSRVMAVKKSLSRSVNIARAALEIPVAGLVKAKPVAGAANAIRRHAARNYHALWCLRRQCRSLTK